jgi:hypothetical protein
MAGFSRPTACWTIWSRAPITVGLALHEADITLAVSEDTVTARRLAVRGVERGRRFGAPELEMVGLRLEGRALVSEGRLEEGCTAGRGDSGGAGRGGEEPVLRRLLGVLLSTAIRNAQLRPCAAVTAGGQSRTDRESIGWRTSNVGATLRWRQAR